jgi:small redox-active disulfide protein 2
MKIKVLGSGCENCRKLYHLVEEAIKETGVNAELTKVEDISGIMEYGVMRTPALVVNDKVKVYGRVPQKEEVKKIIQEV